MTTYFKTDVLLSWLQKVYVKHTIIDQSKNFQHCPSFRTKGEIYTHDLAEIYEISPIVEMTERIILFSLASNDKITPHTDQ
jgi:hypothetical protein